MLLGTEIEDERVNDLFHEIQHVIDGLVDTDEIFQNLLNWVYQKASTVKIPAWYNRVAVRAIYFVLGCNKVCNLHTHDNAMMRDVFSLAWAIDHELGIDLELAIDIGRSNHLAQLYDLVQDIELVEDSEIYKPDFDCQQQEILRKYHTANKIFMDCLAEADKTKVSIREQFEDAILLPVIMKF